LPKPILNKNGADLLKAQTGLLTQEQFDANAVTELAKKNPDSGAHLYLAALADLRANKKDEAIAKLKDAARLSPSESDYVSLLVELGVKPEDLAKQPAAEVQTEPVTTEKAAPQAKEASDGAAAE
jgi:hypothetical protein